jgi:hypothetical protein
MRCKDQSDGDDKSVRLTAHHTAGATDTTSVKVMELGPMGRAEINARTARRDMMRSARCTPSGKGLYRAAGRETATVNSLRGGTESTRCAA